MSLSFLMDEMNVDFINELGTRWQVEFDKERYYLINPSAEAITRKKSISAVLKFFVDFGGHYLQDEADKESRTALNAYTELFQETGYTVHLVDNFLSNTLSYQKNMSKTERFHYYNGRYGAEFIVSGTNVYLYRKIGSHRPEVRIDEDLNVKDATVEIDDANFFTWCKCYYDKIDDTEGGAEEYRHEVVYADQGLIDQYGEIEGPAIYQGSIKDEQVMLDYAKKVQEESIKVSHSVTLADLRRQGYDEFIFRAGDTIRLSLSSINTTVDIRIMEIDETFDAQGELMGLSLTLGNFDPVKTYKSNRNAALMTVEDWMRGRKTIPNNMLEDAIQRAADIVTGDTDSVMEYRKDRLIGHHDKNAGNNVQLNVSGLVYYRNGVPKTAMTYEGFIGDAITTGIIHTNNAKIQGTEGHFTIDGDMFKAVDYNDSEKYVEISPDGFHAHKGMFKITRPDNHVIMNDGVPQWSFTYEETSPPLRANGVTQSGVYVFTNNSEYSNFAGIYFEHNTRYINLRGFGHMHRGDGNPINYGGNVRIVTFGESPNVDATDYIAPSNIEGNQKFVDLTLDLTQELGPPDGTMKSIYLQMKASDGSGDEYLRFRRLMLRFHG